MYPPKPIKIIINELKTIKCDECRKHYIADHDKHNVEDVVKDNENLINYFFNLHNDVNKRNNKQILSRTECDKLYT